MSNIERDACARALEREFGARVRCDREYLEKYAWDYGRLICRTPAIVVSVRDAEELVTALRIGVDFGMPISTRGSAHSVSGLCLGDGALVLDMKALTDVELDTERGCGWLHAGAEWHQVANAAFAEGCMPIGLTTIVDTTVGGTLSVGGIGAESFRTGMQVDQVLELDVATLDGKMERCSLEHNCELFNAVRAGVGQCGIIVRARYPLRRAKARIRTHTLAYTEPDKLLGDMLAIGAEARCEFMFAALPWTEQSGWQMLLLLGNEFEHEAELNGAELLSGLQYKRELPSRDDPQWQTDGQPGHPFVRRYVERNAGTPRPWVDHLCEPSAAGELLAGVLAEPAVAPRAGTSGVVLNVAAHPNRAPLVSPRAVGPLVLLGLMPEPTREQQQDAMARMQRHSERGCALGGKRYLSGFLDGWGAREWSAHYGERWPWFREMKERFDPRELLNHESIRWR